MGANSRAVPTAFRFAWYATLLPEFISDCRSSEFYILRVVKDKCTDRLSK